MEHIELIKDSYHDSVTLMLLSRNLSNLPGISHAAVLMGTSHNHELLVQTGFDSQKLSHSTSNDLIIAVKTDDQSALDAALLTVKEHFGRQKNENFSEYRPRSLSTAIKLQPDTSLALISLPGEYASAVADECLDRDLAVMIFSDNVSEKDELRLKLKARDKGLLVMGPDCGTAIIAGHPLAFANRVRRGSVGIVGASGTGIQEVSVTVHKLGQGISHAIGTGGRDLSREVGGLTMLEGIRILSANSETHVIVLISKPPHPKITKIVLTAAKQNEKPVIINFIGAEPEPIQESGAIPAATLENAAIAA
ncbi:MAG: FdrA family protein, partial [Candidatus Wallbacteria bacterium]|nr:FdrA family protein [Candidatus Wallbacteria bacterium]